MTTTATAAAAAATKKILVTGANTGIGLALVERLVTEHGDDCFVYLGSRNLDKGTMAKDALVRKHPSAASRIGVIQIDITDSDSVMGAAAHVRKDMDNNNSSNSSSRPFLYALVNNAGVGLQTARHQNDPSFIIDTNYRGPKRVTAAFLDLMDPLKGRIVNVGSGAASMWLQHRDAETKRIYSDPASAQEVDGHVQALIDARNTGSMNGYALSKAALTAWTIVQAKRHPHLTIVSLSPGFVDTNMTAGYNAPLTPHQGCKSILTCLFSSSVTTGCYYGSDGLRSPLTVTRDPGTPEYQGEPNPDPARYNN